MKAYTTRVGAGPFPTELHDGVADALRAKGHEFGTTTGRPRRCGWLDMVLLEYSMIINGFSALNLTKLDVLSGLDELKLGVAYKTKDGTILPTFPADLQVLEDVEVRSHDPNTIRSVHVVYSSTCTVRYDCNPDCPAVNPAVMLVQVADNMGCVLVVGVCLWCTWGAPAGCL